MKEQPPRPMRIVRAVRGAIARTLRSLASTLNSSGNDVGRLEPQRDRPYLMAPRKIPVKAPPPMVRKENPKCDSCVAESRFRIKVGKHELYFCGHHFRMHRFELVKYEVERIDGS